MVFATHYLSFEAGWIGVNLFFVLSGFLITGILFDSQDRRHRFRDFYARRALRIFPLYYAVWLGLLLLTPLVHIDWKPINLLWPLYLGNFIGVLKTLYPSHNYSLGIISHPLVSQPLQILYINSGHFWSLCLEEQFYLIWPLVVYSVRKRIALLRICIGGVVLVTLLRLACHFVFSSKFVGAVVLHNLIFFRFDEFLVGGAAALVLRGSSAVRLRAAGSWLFWVATILLVVCRLYPRLFNRLVPNPLGQATWIFYFGITIADLLALGIILMCLNPRNWLSRLLKISPLRALGKISYGFYVFHDLPSHYYRYLMFRWTSSPGAAVAFAFCGTLLLSIASYFLLERPFLKLKLRYED